MTHIVERLAIISCVIRNGELELYQKALIDSINQLSALTYVVYNGELNVENKSDLIFLKSKSEIDVCMWRDVVVLLYSKKEISKYDEVVLLNDSIIGPFYNLNKVFDYMRLYDYWGFTKNYIRKEKKGVFKGRGKHIICEYVQRYFNVFSYKVIMNDSIKNLFMNMNVRTYEEAEEKYEFLLFNQIQSLGFLCGTYCDLSTWYHNNQDIVIPYFIVYPYKLVKEVKMPFLSKYVFEVNHELLLNYSCVNEIEKALRYININTKYDIEVIFQYLINNCNPYTIWLKLGLSFSLSANNAKNSIRQKTALIVHLYYSDTIEQSFDYLYNVPDEVDIIITTCKKNYEKITELGKHLNNNIEIFCVENRGREWRALLVDLKDIIIKYDYFGFIHDKKSSQMYYWMYGSSFKNYLWDNMISSKEYIYNAISILQNDNHIGILSPAVIYTGEYWGHYDTFWTKSYEITSDLAKKMKLSIYPQKSLPVITIGSCFWAKTDALMPLFLLDLNGEDFPEEPMDSDGTINHAFERIISFVAQNQGYLTCTILNDDYQRFNEVTKSYLLQTMIKLLKKNNKDVSSVFNTFWF